jgi:hypothetical protein
MCVGSARTSPNLMPSPSSSVTGIRRLTGRNNESLSATDLADYKPAELSRDREHRSRQNHMPAENPVLRDLLMLDDDTTD